MFELENYTVLPDLEKISFLVVGVKKLGDDFNFTVSTFLLIFFIFFSVDIFRLITYEF